MSQAPGAGADDDEESVGLFSIFKKTDQPRPDEAPDPLSDDDAARLAANSETARQHQQARQREIARATACLLYTSPSPRDGLLSRMPSSA